MSVGAGHGHEVPGVQEVKARRGILHIDDHSKEHLRKLALGF